MGYILDLSATDKFCKKKIKENSIEISIQSLIVITLKRIPANCFWHDDF